MTGEDFSKSSLNSALLLSDALSLFADARTLSKAKPLPAYNSLLSRVFIRSHPLFFKSRTTATLRGIDEKKEKLLENGNLGLFRRVSIGEALGDNCKQGFEDREGEKINFSNLNH